VLIRPLNQGFSLSVNFQLVTPLIRLQKNTIFGESKKKVFSLTGAYMLALLRSNKYYLWLGLFLLTILPFVVSLFDHRPKDTCGNEKFDPSLGSLKSIEQILAYADKEYKGGSL